MLTLTLKRGSKVWVGDRLLYLDSIYKDKIDVWYKGRTTRVSKGHLCEMCPELSIMYRFKKGSGASIGFKAPTKTIWRDK